ncbi:MAG: DUF2157 domain-containing protein [Leptolyngbyaceae cyanobacterium bins.59]|nr:DUF2157 domain-containing protein [Leptolyngbyaceae cyanobacterium bins.59]
MLSEKFRRQLRQEIALWQEEGLIEPSLHQYLSDRYQLHTLETVARDRFVMILLAVGSVLLGLAVITFVAANWQNWPRSWKAVLLFSLLIGINGSGFYLWRKGQGNSRRQTAQHRLGHGLLLFGALTLGANMALMAQMFHIGGSGYELFLAWGLGVFIMALSLGLTSLGILSILLIGIGYLVGMSELRWTGVLNEASWSSGLLDHMPLATCLLLIPLAYRCRSRTLFGLSSVLLITSLEVGLRIRAIQVDAMSVGTLAALGFALPPALLWSYDDRIWPSITSRYFQPLARTLAVLFFGGLCYWFSFRWTWWWRSGDAYNFRALPHSDLTQWPLLWDITFLLGWMIFAWWWQVRQIKRSPSGPSEGLTTAAMGGLIAIVALVPASHTLLWEGAMIPTFLFNILLFLLASGLIRDSLEQGNRRNFWFGIVLLTLQIVSRMLEYNTDLLFKSLVFFLCGVSIIVAGLWFEHYLSRLNRTPKDRHEHQFS